MENRSAGRIALVEHDPAVAATLMGALRRAGHACRRFADGASALREIDEARFDLLIVGRDLPDIPARELMAGVRARLGFALPVIGLVRAERPEAIVAALDDGADACLARPVAPALLIAHVNAAMRRASPCGPRIEAALGHLRFQPEGLKVFVDGRPTLLTAKEYALALMLCRNIGRPLDRDHILATIWGDEIAPLTRTLDVHVSRLRAKLELRPDRGFRLVALYGRGYRLDQVAADEAEASPRFTPRRSASPSARPAQVHLPLAR
ncbi:response regulator transcription factor [Sphingomonas profundi]|uniref:response regulator transcription factor n=1 Tax=Alterirhizorhabdus profundi TaxID=2681549 RepID=UPI0012E96217|nr:response regulator transcription factor [Sphingomonas profundi]